MSDERVSDETLDSISGIACCCETCRAIRELKQHRQRERELRDVVVKHIHHHPHCDLSHPQSGDSCSCDLDAKLSKYPWLRQLIEEAGR